VKQALTAEEPACTECVSTLMRTKTERSSALFAQVKVGGALTDAIIDNGSSVSLATDLFVYRNPEISHSVQSIDTRVLRGFGNNNINVKQKVLATIWIDPLEALYHAHLCPTATFF
jgi:hypothetical protein